MLIRRSRAGGEFGGESEPSLMALLSSGPPAPFEKGSSPSRWAEKGSSVDGLMVGLSMAVRMLVSSFPDRCRCVSRMIESSHRLILMRTSKAGTNRNQANLPEAGVGSTVAMFAIAEW